jgi:hypothetical protein
MKVTIAGRTPMERLQNFTKRVIAVPKNEIEREDNKWKKQKSAQRQRKAPKTG